MAILQHNIRICVIATWFGEWPPYLPCLLVSCAFNKDIDWLFIGDRDFPCPQSDNIRMMKMSSRNFAAIATERLGFKVSIGDPYKICDFKPLFGKIYEDQLNTFDYWGYFDLDMVFGNLNKYLEPLLARQPDIVSFYPDFLSGPFCLYKNCSTVNNLYSRCPGHQAILEDPKHRAFDENIPQQVAGARLFIYRVSYLMKVIFRGPRYRLNVPELRYHFQWYAKQLNSRCSLPSDMTDVIHKASREGHIQVVFKDLIRSDRDYRRSGLRSWKISWENGHLTDRRNAREMFAYHFVDTKKNPAFMVEPAPCKKGEFIISEKGTEKIGHGSE